MLKCQNRAFHAFFSLFSPVRLASDSFIILSVAFCDTTLSSHQLPVMLSHVTAAGSCTHTTLPGNIPFAVPTGWFGTTIHCAVLFCEAIPVSLPRMKTDPPIARRRNTIPTE